MQIIEEEFRHLLADLENTRAIAEKRAALISSLMDALHEANAEADALKKRLEFMKNRYETMSAELRSFKNQHELDKKENNTLKEELEQMKRTVDTQQFRLYLQEEKIKVQSRRIMILAEELHGKE